MAKHRHAGKTVAEILKEKKGTIKDAEMETGSPAWDDILHLTWEEVVQRAKNRERGFKRIKKLLGNKEYDK